ncbi:hypothetical protein DVH24_002159 [Malus domestica]|uniref:Uncharacterized protein n=1 Tax=Malus domestica TaxID=3750 RepID=A0A498IAR9_MALDO|nr:hypothetical protein DVH24_002159 [Malus domestica]
MVEPSSTTTTSPPLQRATPEPPPTSHCLDELYEIHKRGKDPPSFLVLLHLQTVTTFAILVTGKPHDRHHSTAMDHHLPLALLLRTPWLEGFCSLHF